MILLRGTDEPYVLPLGLSAIPNTGHTHISLDQKESLVAPWYIIALLPFTALSDPHFSFSIHQDK